MDGNRFDRLTKSLATPRTRRGVFKSLGAGIAGGLAALGLGQASAAPGGQGKGGGSRCGGPGQPCKWNRQCCEYSGLICVNGSCGCEDNFCPATGACMPDCPAGKVFERDTCTCECPETCAGNEVQDPDTCACTCTQLCGGVCCPTGTRPVIDPLTGLCFCAE